jgi:DNA-binding response OmpR family regulator
MNTPPSTTPPEKSGNGSASASLERRERILLVDDDAEMRSLLTDVLNDEGYEVLQAANGAEALITLHRETVAAILLDKNMPDLSGMDILPGLRLICPRTPIIIITAFGDEHTRAEAEERGGSGVLFKPFQIGRAHV